MTARRAASLWQHAARALAGRDSITVYFVPLVVTAGICRGYSGGHEIFIDDRWPESDLLDTFCHEAAHARLRHSPERGAPIADQPDAVAREDHDYQGPPELLPIVAAWEAEAKDQAAAWLAECDAACGPGAPIDVKLYYLATGIVLPDLG